MSETPSAGEFCWVELAVPDQNAAKAFYMDLFGWNVTDIPMGPSETYSMFDIEGDVTAAAFRLTPEMRAEGVPPSWSVYIAVDDVDASAVRVPSIGGSVLRPPFDVNTAGRMAVIADPSNAAFCIWQGRDNLGIGRFAEDNSFCWAELSTPDPDGVKGFYEQLFGWKISASPNDPSGYLQIQSGADFIGGIPPAHMRDASVPPHWLVYFQTEDCDGCSAKAEALGSRLIVPPLSVPQVGRMSVISDPQGVVFALFEPQHAA